MVFRHKNLVGRKQSCHCLGLAGHLLAGGEQLGRFFASLAFLGVPFILLLLLGLFGFDLSPFLCIVFLL